MSVDIILKDIEWDGVNKIRVPLEGGGTQDFSIGGGSANLQTKSKTYTPSTSQQTDTVSPDTGYDGLSSVNVTVNAMPTGEFVDRPTYGVENDVEISVSSSGLITANVETLKENQQLVETAGYFDTTDTIDLVFEGSNTYQLPTQGATTITPSTSQQTAVTSGKYTTGNVVVSAVPSMTLPSTTTSSPTGTWKANFLPSTSQRYLNIPAGYNETAQYYQIIGMELAPLNVTANGTYNASDADVTGFNTVTVNVPTGSANLQTKSATYTPTSSQQTDTITPDSGYDGLDEVDITINAVPTGSVTMPSSITTSGGTAFYTTQATLVVSASATATPDVTQAGYISSGTSGTTSLVVATTIPTVNAQTLYPSTTDQTIPTNRYTKGTQTIKAVTTNNIIASNIKEGVTVEVGDADDPDRVLSVTGTYSGGASNFVTGTFTTGSSAGASSLTIPYTGSGYPVMAVIVVDGGAYTSGTTWYNSVQRYAVGQWTMTKANMTTTPSYTTSGAQNQGVTTWVFKNSTSSSTSYSRSSAMNTNVFSSNNASNSGANTIKLHSGNVLSYYVNTSSYGLHPSMTYRYYIVYSS